MHRLSELKDKTRNRLGAGSLVAGLALVTIGVLLAHYSGLGSDSGVVPSGCFIGTDPRCVPWGTVGHVIAFVGSQLALVGAALIWVAGGSMTWARAGFAAFLVWIEFVLIFGIVPSEWLKLSQGPLEMSNQRIFLTVPRWLVLGNDVSISWAAVKDAISGTYNVAMVGVAIWLALALQRWGKPKSSSPGEAAESVYGRPLVKGSR